MIDTNNVLNLNNNARIVTTTTTSSLTEAATLTSIPTITIPTATVGYNLNESMEIYELAYNQSEIKLNNIFKNIISKNTDDDNDIHNQIVNKYIQDHKDEVLECFKEIKNTTQTLINQLVIKNFGMKNQIHQILQYMFNTKYENDKLIQENLDIQQYQYNLKIELEQKKHKWKIKKQSYIQEIDSLKQSIKEYTASLKEQTDSFDQALKNERKQKKKMEKWFKRRLETLEFLFKECKENPTQEHLFIKLLKKLNHLKYKRPWNPNNPNKMDNNLNRICGNQSNKHKKLLKHTNDISQKSNKDESNNNKTKTSHRNLILQDLMNIDDDMISSSGTSTPFSHYSSMLTMDAVSQNKTINKAFIGSILNSIDLHDNIHTSHYNNNNISCIIINNSHSHNNHNNNANTNNNTNTKSILTEQILHKFNHGNLSISEKEQIIYSLIKNQNSFFKENPNHVQLDDLLNATRTSKIEETNSFMADVNNSNINKGMIKTGFYKKGKKDDSIKLNQKLKLNDVIKKDNPHNDNHNVYFDKDLSPILSPIQPVTSLRTNHFEEEDDGDGEGNAETNNKKTSANTDKSGVFILQDNDNILNDKNDNISRDNILNYNASPSNINISNKESKKNCFGDKNKSDLINFDNSIMNNNKKEVNVMINSNSGIDMPKSQADDHFSEKKFFKENLSESLLIGTKSDEKSYIGNEFDEMMEFVNQKIETPKKNISKNVEKISDDSIFSNENMLKFLNTNNNHLKDMSTNPLLIVMTNKKNADTNSKQNRLITNSSNTNHHNANNNININNQANATTHINADTHNNNKDYPMLMISFDENSSNNNLNNNTNHIIGSSTIKTKNQMGDSLKSLLNIIDQINITRNSNHTNTSTNHKNHHNVNNSQFNHHQQSYIKSSEHKNSNKANNNNAIINTTMINNTIHNQQNNINIMPFDISFLKKNHNHQPANNNNQPMNNQPMNQYILSQGVPKLDLTKLIDKAKGMNANSTNHHSLNHNNLDKVINNISDIAIKKLNPYNNSIDESLSSSLLSSPSQLSPSRKNFSNNNNNGDNRYDIEKSSFNELYCYSEIDNNHQQNLKQHQHQQHLTIINPILNLIDEKSPLQQQKRQKQQSHPQQEDILAKTPKKLVDEYSSFYSSYFQHQQQEHQQHQQQQQQPNKKSHLTNRSMDSSLNKMNQSIANTSLISKWPMPPIQPKKSTRPKHNYSLVEELSNYPNQNTSFEDRIVTTTTTTNINKSKYMNTQVNNYHQGKPEGFKRKVYKALNNSVENYIVGDQNYNITIENNNNNNKHMIMCLNHHQLSNQHHHNLNPSTNLQQLNNESLLFNGIKYQYRHSIAGCGDSSSIATNGHDGLADGKNISLYENKTSENLNDNQNGGMSNLNISKGDNHQQHVKNSGLSNLLNTQTKSLFGRSNSSTNYSQNTLNNNATKYNNNRYNQNVHASSINGIFQQRLNDNHSLLGMINSNNSINLGVSQNQPFLRSLTTPDQDHNDNNKKFNFCQNSNYNLSNYSGLANAPTRASYVQGFEPNNSKCDADNEYKTMPTSNIYDSRASLPTANSRSNTPIKKSISIHLLKPNSPTRKDKTSNFNCDYRIKDVLYNNYQISNSSISKSIAENPHHHHHNQSMNINTNMMIVPNNFRSKRFKEVNNLPSNTKKNPSINQQ